MKDEFPAFNPPLESRKNEFPAFSPPPELLVEAIPPDKQDYLKKVKPKGFLEKALGRSERHQIELQAAETEYEIALKAHNASKQEKKAKIEQLKAEYDSNQEAFLTKIQQRANITSRSSRE